MMAGLIAAAVGGIVVGALGGAPPQVAGSAAGLTVMVYGLVQQYGFKAVGAITVAAGVLQMILGALRVAGWGTSIWAIWPSVTRSRRHCN